MREILFRGKRTDNGKWIYGSPVFQDGYVLIRFWNSEEFEYEEYLVAPESISEFIGLTDKNGRKIFEGDIVKLTLIDSVEIGVIKFDNIKCRFMFDDQADSWGFDDTCEFEVIGNVFDNADLLEG